jgi:hypothetical protein
MMMMSKVSATLISEPWKSLENYLLRMALPVSLPGLTGQSSKTLTVVTGSPGQAGR